MQEIPCARCGNYVLERYAVKGVLIDDTSRESYCSEECRDAAQSAAYRAASGQPSTDADWVEADDSLDPFAE